MEHPKTHYLKILQSIQQEGLYKTERTIVTPQGVLIKTREDKTPQGLKVALGVKVAIS